LLERLRQVRSMPGRLISANDHRKKYDGKGPNAQPWNQPMSNILLPVRPDLWKAFDVSQMLIEQGHARYRH